MVSLGMEDGTTMTYAKSPKGSNPRDVDPFIVDICGDISKYKVMWHGTQRTMRQQSFNYPSAVGRDWNADGNEKIEEDSGVGESGWSGSAGRSAHPCHGSNVNKCIMIISLLYKALLAFYMFYSSIPAANQMSVDVVSRRGGVDGVMLGAGRGGVREEAGLSW